jgi:hypothetical protein
VKGPAEARPAENLMITAPNTTFNYDGLMRLYQVTGADRAV